MGYSTVRRIMREGLTDPRNLDGIALWNSTRDVTDLTTDTGIKLWADKSGNSSTNVLCLNANTSNFANFTALAAFGTGNFTVAAKFSVSAIGTTQAMLAGANNSPVFYVDATGKLSKAKSAVGNILAGSTTLSAFTTYTAYYVRSGTTGTFYLNAVADSAGAADAVDYTVGLSKIGQSDTTPANAFGGLIYAVRAYSAALTPAEITADYNGTVQANCVLNQDFSGNAKLAPSVTAAVGGTVTINTSGATGARISGARDLYQGTAANQPILTIAAAGNYLTFDGSNDYLKAAAFALAQPETVYFVGSQVTWVADRYFYDGGTADRMALIQRTSTPTLRIYASGGGNYGGAQSGMAVATNAVSTAVYSGAASSHRINRTAAVAGPSVGTGAGNGFTLGSAANPAAYGNITAQEVVVYSTAQDENYQYRVTRLLSRRTGVLVV